MDCARYFAGGLGCSVAEAPEGCTACFFVHCGNQRRRINAFGEINRNTLKVLGAQIVNSTY